MSSSWNSEKGWAETFAYSIYWHTSARPVFQNSLNRNNLSQLNINEATCLKRVSKLEYQAWREAEGVNENLKWSLFERPCELKKKKKILMVNLKGLFRLYRSKFKANVDKTNR